MRGTKARTEVFEEARGKLDVPGQQLEACEVVEGARRFLVLVCRVEYGGGSYRKFRRGSSGSRIAGIP